VLPPACAEHGEVLQAAVEVQPPGREIADDLVGSDGVETVQRHRPNRAVLLDTQDFLQNARRAGGPGVDAEVEHQQVDATRQIVAAHDVPVARPVDFLGFFDRERVHVVEGDGGVRRAAAAPVRQGTNGDAVLRGAAAVAGIVGEAALGTQNKRKASIEIRSFACRHRHGGSGLRRRRVMAGFVVGADDFLGLARDDLDLLRVLRRLCGLHLPCGHVLVA
jgi:hypothetical protein